MGACCVSRDGGDHEIDLPMADQKSIVGNVFQKFEGSLPFQCSWVDAFERRVRNAARLTGGANELAPGQKEEFAPGEVVKEYSVTKQILIVKAFTSNWIQIMIKCVSKTFEFIFVENICVEYS